MVVVGVSAVASSVQFFDMQAVLSGTGAVTLASVCDGGSGLGGECSSKVQ